MTEPWLDELEDKRRARRGCGCSTRAKIILVVVIMGLILACFLGNTLIERYHERQKVREQIDRQERIQPPQSTPVVVPPAGGQVMPTPIKATGG